MRSFVARGTINIFVSFLASKPDSESGRSSFFAILVIISRSLSIDSARAANKGVKENVSQDYSSGKNRTCEQTRQ